MASVSKRQWTHKGVTKEAWQVRYIDRESGKRRGKMFDLKKDADAYKRRVEREIEDGLHIAPGDAKTVAMMIDEYIANERMRRQDGRIGMAHLYKTEAVLLKKIAPIIGRIKATDLTEKAVDDLYRGFVNEGLTPRTAKQYLLYLYGLEKFANRRKYMKAKPVAEALSQLQRVGQRRAIKTFTTDEVARLLRTSDNYRPNDGRSIQQRSEVLLACFVYLAALCGLRWGESPA